MEIHNFTAGVCYVIIAISLVFTPPFSYSINQSGSFIAAMKEKQITMILRVSGAKCHESVGP